MIDENLCRAELSPSDRARQTARRKPIYLELHPETASRGEKVIPEVMNTIGGATFDTGYKLATTLRDD